MVFVHVMGMATVDELSALLLLLEDEEAEVDDEDDVPLSSCAPVAVVVLETAVVAVATLTRASSNKALNRVPCRQNSFHEAMVV